MSIAKLAFKTLTVKLYSIWQVSLLLFRSGLFRVESQN